MQPDELKSHKLFMKAVAESKKELESISALDFMARACDFQNQLIRLADASHLTPSLIVGLLTAEIFRVSYDSKFTELAAAFELLQRYADKHDALLKEYIDKNFMKKEKGI